MADREELLMLAGPVLASYLEDGDVTEIMVNDNGTAFLNRYGIGMSEVPHPDEACVPGQSHLDNFLSAIAHAAGEQWNTEHCQLEAALEDLGWRIEAGRPPAAPGFYMSLRKHALQIFPLDDYEAKGILTKQEREIMEEAMVCGKRMIIAGAVGSAKTSLVNALLHSIRDTEERVILVEEIPEIHCEVRNCTRIRIQGRKGKTNLQEQIQRTLRLFPSRLIIGEVRGGEALDMLMAYQTGHSGLTTLHVNEVHNTMSRLERCVQIASKNPQRALIGEVIDLIVHMKKWGKPPWRCTGILALEGYLKKGKYQFTQLTEVAA